MRLQKNGLIISIVALLLSVAIVCVCIMIHKRQENEARAEFIYSQIQDDLSEYPTLPEAFGYTKLYFFDGINEYMYFKNGDKQITAMRSDGVEAVYFADGKTWVLDSADTLIETSSAPDPVEEAVEKAVKSLLTDRDITYSYHLAKGIPLPKWVYPGEEYLLCQRKTHPDHMEVMVSETADHGRYISWDIVAPNGDIVLFLYICEYMEEPNRQGEDVLFGWGTLDGDVYASVFY